MNRRCRSAATSALVLASAAALPAMAPGDGTVTLIHIGDLHGHLTPRADVRGAGSVGGLARVYTVIEAIRARRPGAALLVNVGDALQGSAEALYTRGQAVIDVLDLFAIDAFVPGNWDYLYGVERFMETFAGEDDRAPLARWPAIAVNLYFATPDTGMRSRYVDRTGERVLPPYIVRDVGGVRVGIIGITTMRGPRALGREATRGLVFTPPQRELSALVDELRSTLSVDVVVVASELELANNIVLAERTPGIDVILSGDMHELTTRPIVTSTGTIIVEEGQDGAAVGELTLTVRAGRVRRWEWRTHPVTDSVAEHPAVAARVAAARAPFVRGPRLDVSLRNPITGARLGAPIDEVVGYTSVALHRANPATAEIPAVLEGSSHDFLADAFRAMTGADIALIRGFRFGTHVRPGAITREDLYHFLPIGARVARVDGVPGAVILRQLEGSLAGALDADPGRWTGGWFVGTSGLELDVDPYRPAGERVRAVRVNGEPLDTTGARRYSVAGLWFALEPRAVSNCAPCVPAGAVVRTIGDAPMDAVEVVARYLSSLSDSVATPKLGRVRLRRALPAPTHGFPELQPLAGVGSAGSRRRNAAGQRPPPSSH